MFRQLRKKTFLAAARLSRANRRKGRSCRPTRPAFEMLETRLVLNGGPCLSDEIINLSDCLYDPSRGELAWYAELDISGPQEQAPLQMAAAGVPALHSNPGAPAAVYVDFDGGYWREPRGAYDTDGDPTTFSVSEIGDITDAWEEISTYFAMFDVDVTTEEPNTGQQPTSWTLVTPDMSGGAASFSFPTNSPAGANNAANARSRTTGIVHEHGHVFHIPHQSEWDLQGNQTREYRRSQDNVGSLMGVDYAGVFAQWWLGHPSNSPSNVQDDIAIIIDQITRHAKAGYTGDGFHADDFGGDIDNPTADATHLTPSGGVWSTAGTIERMTDVDTFSFDWTGGQVKVEARDREGITSSMDVISSAGLDLQVFDSAGTLVGFNDVQSQSDYVFDVTMNLPADRYYVVVESHGDYSDLGVYDITINGVGGSPLDEPISGSDAVAALVSVDAASDFWNNIVLQLENDDPTSVGVVVDKSTDGVHWAQVYSDVGYQANQTFNDTNVTPGETYFYRYGILGGSGGDRYSNRVIVEASPKPVYGGTFTPWKPNEVILNWRDVSGDTGYAIEQSTDGINYTQIATVPTNWISYTPTGLIPNTNYHFRIKTLGGDHTSDSAATVITGTTPVDPNALPPNATDDTAEAFEDQFVVIDVLANDSDPNGDPLSIDGFTQPANGTVTDNGDGTLTYTPDPGYTGTDQFNYTITDGFGGEDTATVTITVFYPTNTWQGGTDAWSAPNWSDGNSSDLEPMVGAAMIIDVAGSKVRVEQDFVSGGTGPARSVVIGENYVDGHDVGAEEAEAFYDPVTGEVFFDVGENVAVVGIASDVMLPGNADPFFTEAPAQNNGTTLAFYNPAGLPVGEDSVGLVLPAGLAQEDIAFSFTPVGGDTTSELVTVLGTAWSDGEVAELQIDAALEVKHGISIGSKATLSGSGTVLVGEQLQVTAGGTVSPGNSIGMLGVEGDVVLDGGSTAAIELSGSGAIVAGVNNDLITAHDLTLTGTPTLELEWLAGKVGDGLFGGIYTIATYSGTLSGTFANPTLSADFNGADASVYIDTTYGVGGVDYGTGMDDAITVKLNNLLVGDANLDGDVDVFQLDGSGDAQILSSNLGMGGGDGHDVGPEEAEALYNSLTGELFFDVGENVSIVGVGVAGMFPANVVETSIFGTPSQNDGALLAYFDPTGLPVGEDSVGLVLPTGLAPSEITFAYTPVGSDTVFPPVQLIGSNWGDGDFNFDGDVDVFQLDGSGDAQLLSSNLGTGLDIALSQDAPQSQQTSGESLASLDWQYEYQSTQSKQAKSTDVEAAVDLLLATDWA